MNQTDHYSQHSQLHARMYARTRTQSSTRHCSATRQPFNESAPAHKHTHIRTHAHTLTHTMRSHLLFAHSLIHLKAVWNVCTLGTSRRICSATRQPFNESALFSSKFLSCASSSRSKSSGMAGSARRA